MPNTTFRRLVQIWTILLAASAAAQISAYNGQCATGGQAVITQNIKSRGTQPINGSVTSLTSGVLASYPSCIVSVYLTGTSTLANIYSNVSSTPLANPFTANTNGSFLFFAAAGGYDITLSGAGLPATVTLTDVQLGVSGGSPPTNLTLLTNGILNPSQTTFNLQNGANFNFTPGPSGTVIGNVTGVLTGVGPSGALAQVGTRVDLAQCPNGQTWISTGTGQACGVTSNPLVLQINGSLASSQVLQNLIPGTNISITDSGGGQITIATTGLNINSSSQYAMPYYSASPSGTTLSGVAGPTTPNGVPQVFTITPAASAATLGSWNPAGVKGRAVTGTTSTDTILSTDCSPNRVEYTGSVAVAVTLPTATTLGVPFCVFRISNQTSPAQTVTVTPTTWTCNGASTCPLSSGQVGTFYVDPLGTNWVADINATTSTSLSGSGSSPFLTKWTGPATLGNSQTKDDGTHPVSSPNGYGLAATGGITFDKVNDTSTGTTANLFVCKSATAGSVVTCPLSTTAGVLGVAVAGIGTAPGTSGSTSVCYSGICSVIVDNTSVIGDYCIPSTTTAGRCHDTGATTPTSGVISFFVLSVATAGNAATIEVLTPDWYTQNAPVNTVTAASAATAAKQVCVSSGATRTCTYIDFPDPKIIPAANCNNTTAGNGWSIPASNAPTVACRAGTNNLGGVLQWANNNTTTNAQFMYEIPGDWDSSVQPYINIFYGSGANTSGTVKWTFSSACTKSDGSVTDDPAFNAETATTGKTMAVANREWAESLQFTAVTSGNNCVAGGTIIFKITSGNGTATSTVNVDKATITFPRLLTVQAN